MRIRGIYILLFGVFIGVFQPVALSTLNLSPDVRSNLEKITADSLRGDLSFIASDALEGRATPSRGLDIAAEYIAAQFRRAGLEPVGDQGYFQTAPLTILEPDFSGFKLNIGDRERSFAPTPNDLSLNISKPIDLQNTPVFKLDLSDGSQIEKLVPTQLTNNVVITRFDERAIRNYRLASRVLHNAKPAVFIVIDTSGATAGAPNAGELVDSEYPSQAVPRITLLTDEAAAFFASLTPGATGANATIHIAAPQRRTVAARNVIGILRGSDPELQSTSVLLSAHYDHLGERGAGPGDRIYNGANDDGSGTVSVIEVARALSAMKQRPRRSILFVTFFGEEEGLIGSRYYVHHPVWPLDKTVAQLNLEQLGRTDSTEGPQLSNATMTGFDFSNVAEYLRAAGELTGVRIYKNSRESDLYFNASDNYSLAEAGIPAHTLTVAFNYPDYHAVGDEWQKINYENMAKVDRAVALTIYFLADSQQAPHWNERDPKVAPYLRVWREHHQ